MHTMPHFNVTNFDGEPVNYATDVWQRKNVVLMAVPAGTDRRQLSKRYAPLGSEDTRLVITSEPVAGITPPAVVVADQWGEIAHSAAAPKVAELPAPDELLSWLEHVRQRCPECEGEAR